MMMLCHFRYASSIWCKRAGTRTRLADKLNKMKANRYTGLHLMVIGQHFFFLACFVPSAAARRCRARAMRDRRRASASSSQSSPSRHVAPIRLVVELPSRARCSEIVSLRLDKSDVKNDDENDDVSSSSSSSSSTLDADVDASDIFCKIFKIVFFQKVQFFLKSGSFIASTKSTLTRVMSLIALNKILSVFDFCSSSA